MIEKLSREAAQKVASAHKIKIVYGNSQGEAFTSKNFALLSEDGNANNIDTFDFSQPETPGAPTAEEKPATQIPDAGTNAGDAATGTGAPGDNGKKVKTVDVTLEQKHFDKNPDLTEQGYKLGDVVTVKAPPGNNAPVTIKPIVTVAPATSAEVTQAQ